MERRRDGVLLVDKPPGPTSHDVVDLARRALGLRRIGHLGTLDPFASGLLVLLVGRATRLASCTAGWLKTYEGTIRLGTVTTTDDPTGDVVATSETWHGVPADAVRAALASLVGVREQRPPAYSAKQLGGERAYRRARRGETVTLAPARVEIRSLTATRIALPDVEFTATVGAGAYLRSLAREVGETLGSGAHLAHLRRTGVGPFTVGEAASVDALTAGRAPVGGPEVLVESLPRVTLDPEQYDAVRHGRQIGGSGKGEEGRVALFHGDRLVAIAEPSGTGLKPRVVLEG